jgi:hypothetical protein
MDDKTKSTASNEKQCCKCKTWVPNTFKFCDQCGTDLKGKCLKIR